MRWATFGILCCALGVTTPLPRAAAQSDLEASDIVARLRAPSGIRSSDVIQEDEWGRPELSCMPISERPAVIPEEEQATGRRGLSPDTGRKVMRRPRLQLQVNFAFGSDELTGEATAQLDELAQAFNDPVLEDERFILIGHTDAVGTAEANSDLSRRRAASVEQYLVEVRGVAPDRLRARGCGESVLADPGDPRSPRNRRVEIVNAGR